MTISRIDYYLCGRVHVNTVWTLRELIDSGGQGCLTCLQPGCWGEGANVNTRQTRDSITSRSATIDTDLTQDTAHYGMSL